VLGEGIAAFKAVCDLDLEGIVAKRLDDAYGPRTKNGGRFSIAAIRRRQAGRNCLNDPDEG